MYEIIIQSSDNISTLTLSNHNKAMESFEVLFHDSNATIKQTSWTIYGDSNKLYHFFLEIDENWKGWKEPIEYIPIENDFVLSATSDNLGHIFLNIIF